MIGEIWDTITENISTAWEFVTELPSYFEGFFTDVNMFGFMILALLAEVGLWLFFYYTVKVKGIENFLDWKTMVIATILTPVIAYIFAYRASK